MLRPVVLAVLVLASAATAQMRGALPGTPMTAPPASSPALAAQPLCDIGSPTRLQTSSPPPGPATCNPAPQPAPDPALAGPQIGGKDLKKAVAKVQTLQWHESLPEARALAAATGKPILWLQALGDLEGFA